MERHNCLANAGIELHIRWLQGVDLRSSLGVVRLHLVKVVADLCEIHNGQTIACTQRFVETGNDHVEGIATGDSSERNLYSYWHNA